jgi:hypothetical protein
MRLFPASRPKRVELGRRCTLSMRRWCAPTLIEERPGARSRRRRRPGQRQPLQPPADQRGQPAWRYEVHQLHWQNGRYPVCEFLKKLHADVGRPLIVFADNASYHKGGWTSATLADSRTGHGRQPAQILARQSRRTSLESRKARLAKPFVATKDESKSALFSILLSIQRSTDLVLSFFQLHDTQYLQRYLLVHILMQQLIPRIFLRL